MILFRAARTLTAGLVALAVIAQAPEASGAVIGGPQLGRHGLVVAKSASALPKVAAAAFLIADADSGQVLAAKDAHGHYLPASTIKTLTSATLIPKLSGSTRIRPNRTTVGVVPVKVGLRTTRSYRVDDLFRAMLLKSANDAAYALAQTGGGFKKTIAAMNAEARRLQAFDTLAASPNGLDRDLGLNVGTQHTSVYDLALIFRQDLGLPAFRGYIGTRKAAFPGGVSLTNGDRLLFSYPGMIGGKPGSTHAAGRSYVGAARRNGHTIIIAELGSNSSIRDDSRKLLDWGLAHAGKIPAVGTLVPPAVPKAAAAQKPPAAGRAPAAPAAWPWRVSCGVLGCLGAYTAGQTAL
jgi:D-alanyl-D-alanine carboxypeptidase (penicillin-binding protein 5/6)